MKIKPNILLIDDDQNFGVLVSKYMTNLGFRIEIATDGFLAVDRLAQITPALVLLDFYMPGLSGHEILAFIAAEDRLAATKVIIITADLLTNPAELCRADALLSKPFTLQSLENAIDHVMNIISNVHTPPEWL